MTFGNYTLEVEVAKTVEYYRTERKISEGCSCDGCQNYEKAIQFVDNEIKSIFKQLGIDKSKVAEIYVNYSENNILYYGGFYHICGKIISGISPWQLVSKTHQGQASVLIKDSMICIGEKFKFAFQEECSLLSDSFPRPCFQMEILISLPWMLNNPNSY